MKKLFALLLVLTMALSLAACGAPAASEDGASGIYDYEAIPNEMTSDDGKYQIAFVTDVGSLLDKNLIEACGRMDAPGRPMLYVTTDKFLRVFGLNSLSELPETEALSIAAAQAEQVEMEIEAPAEEVAPEGEYTEVAEDDSRAEI